MQENKENRQKRAERAKKAQAKARALFEKIKTPESNKYRFLILVVSAVIGLFFGWLVNCYELLAFMGIGFETHGAISAIILVASLPTLIVLWWFRTHDTRQQIQKTQENINANLFGMYLKMLRSENKEERISGLLGLVRLKQKGFFAEEIDATTQQNLNLAELNFMHKDLSGTNLSGANLEGANLEGANLEGVNLSGANLTSANLEDTNFSGANLYDANLKGADLLGAVLVGADLSGANLENANMPFVNLSGANLQNANLVKTNLARAVLTGVNFAIVSRLMEVVFIMAEYDKATKFPEGFNPQEAGMKRV